MLLGILSFQCYFLIFSINNLENEIDQEFTLVLAHSIAKDEDIMNSKWSFSKAPSLEDLLKDYWIQKKIS